MPPSAGPAKAGSKPKKKSAASVQLETEMRGHGWSQRELAEFLDLDEPRVSRLLRGLAKPGRATAVQIADKLGIPVTAWDEPAPRGRAA